MTIGCLLEFANQSLKGSGIENWRLESEWFLCECLGWDRTALILNSDQEPKPSQQNQFFKYLKRRAKGEPFAYILGYQEFYRSRFLVGPGVLIPRPETEMIVEFGVKWLQSIKSKTLKIVDLGCGSGCIGLSLLKECGGYLISVDSSKVALSYAGKNCEALNLQEQTRLVFSRVQDLNHCSQLESREEINADLVVANPPYIGLQDPDLSHDVRRTEPPQALFGGISGLDEIKEWIPIAAKLLRKGGMFLMEHGARQKKDVMRIINEEGKFDCLESYQDLAGWDRMVMAKKI